jgi:membrane-bound lytic murein transglycosylase B
MGASRWSVGAVVIAALLSAPLLRSAAQDATGSETGFEAFLAAVRTEALARGISAATLDATLTGLTPEPVVVTRDRTQPEQVQSLDAYLAQRLTRRTVTTARDMAGRHRALLGEVESRFGVSRGVMVSIWGLESNFGRFTGSYSTIRALATLAFDNRRPL